MKQNKNVSGVGAAAFAVRYRGTSAVPQLYFYEKLVAVVEFVVPLLHQQGTGRQEVRS